MQHFSCSHSEKSYILIGRRQAAFVNVRGLEVYSGRSCPNSQPSVPKFNLAVPQFDDWSDNMLFRGLEAHGRSLAKSVSWRITGSLDTFVISFIVTGKASIAGSIAATELITKIALYYFHERIWAVIPWGHRRT